MVLDSLLLDVRFALRGLRRDIGFAVAAVAAIALGIGANTAIFSVVNTILFRPLPFQQSDRTVRIENTGGADLSSRTSRVANDLDWKRMNKSFEDIAAYCAFFDFGTYNLTGTGEPERLIGVVGKSVFLNGRSFAVTGVLPAAFDFATVFTPGARIDMLTPETDRFGNTLAVMGRLRPGV